MATVAARPAFRLFRTRIASIDASRPSLVRLALTADSLEHFGRAGLDQRIKLVFPPYDDEADAHLPMPDLGPEEFAEPTGMVQLYKSTMALDTPPVWRTYTVRRIDPERRVLEVDLVLHGSTSPSARWLRGARIGDELVVVGPDARSENSRSGIEWNPGSARRILVAGDETALPAIAGIAESGTLPDATDSTVCIVVEAGDPADIEDFPIAPGWEVRRVIRGQGDTPGERLEAEVRALLEERPGLLAHADGPPAEEGSGVPEGAEAVWDTADSAVTTGSYAWLAGEAGAVTRLRRHLVRDLGVDKRAVSFMGYWKLGSAAS
ncbi:siderophore-interacting protein [Dietzia sp.]|uniref:siderophore-interacting protein n=1 Tax=Dietzia sp. TaxID=1871616 RepID=UPI002FDB44EA